MNKNIRWEYKELTASYAARFVQHSLTPGMDSGDWSMRDEETGLIYVCPRPGPHFNIAPDWRVIGPEHICVCDGAGNLVEDNGLIPTVELPMHLAIYAARPECRAIVHSHPLYASAFAVTGEDIPFLLAESGLFLGGSVPCAEYGLIGSEDLGRKIVAALGQDKQAALLRGHGAVVLGRNLGEAFVLSDFMEHAAHVAFMARAVGTPIPLTMDNLIDPDVTL